ncbi:putative esterase and lipase [Diplogelasinospora grovesii]|uniref:Esterase and lipase n=1 Tax=Diplogelasinospora grovesii TaxID=303347 RepID=A0AAN6N839_9PEZI|nr:putative esterase and lipase [Diplogelasinospora grovesii]
MVLTELLVTTRAAISTDVCSYTFKNIRFAAPPVGSLRWAKPAPPTVNTTLQDGSYGPQCEVLGGLPVPIFAGGDEDCLFLDVYVPGKALKNPNLRLPVVVWIYGGAYVFGSKDSLQPDLPFYDGSGMMGQAGNNMIFVAMNYRLGAYGFLAGTTMEADGLPNAGLWDQRAAFQWVKDYIGLVGGDPTQVTAFGESAGAGSIMHHLVAQGGRLDPLFQRAILQSPAFELMWDRAGTIQDTFACFAALAGCKGKGLACLRAADPATLVRANTALNKAQTPPGSFAVGPTPGGSYIRQMPSLELATGHAWPVQSLILSHVADEASLFVSGAIQTDAQFTAFLSTVFPNYTMQAGINAQVEAFYPPSAYANQAARVNAFTRDSCFTCNVRYLTEAIGDSKVWNMQYSVSPGYHGDDLLPTFFNPGFTANSLLEGIAMFMITIVGPMVAGISAAMQSYFTSYIVTGDPNTNRKIWNLPPTVQWNHPSSRGEVVSGVVNVGDWGFSTMDSDTQTRKTPCDFWRGFAAAVTTLGGYAPPGAVAVQSGSAASGDHLKLSIGR